MKRVLGVICVLIAAASTVHCTQGTTCGDGTREVDGACVPTDTTTCGTGTTLVDGACVPDGSVICRQGTRFDAASGTCVVDPSACADGTVLLGDRCVPEDATLMADRDEAAEPNDDDAAGRFDAPALGAMTTLHGCITPRDGAADVDTWIIDAAEPTLLSIAADGVGGLAAAFVVEPLDAPGLADFTRTGMNLAGDTSARQLYLPVAGSYALRMDDSRALLTGDAAGDAGTCYYATVRRIALPAATPAPASPFSGTDDGEVAVWSFAAAADGDIVDVVARAGSSALRPGLVLRKNGAFHAAAGSGGATAATTAGGLAAGETFELVVDAVANRGVTPQPYTIELVTLASAGLPTAGGVVTLTSHNGEQPAAPYRDSNYSYFDVASAGDVVRFDVTAPAGVTMAIVRPDVLTAGRELDTLAALTGGAAPATRATFTGQYVRFLHAGRYYFVTRAPAVLEGATYTVAATLAVRTPTPITYGTPLAGQALPAGARFHSLDLANPEWIELAVTGSDWGAAANTARVTLYDLAGEGWLASASGSAGASYAALQTGTQPPTGAAPIGRVTLGEGRDFLVRVEDSGTPGAAPSYDLAVRDRAHVNLGVVTAGTPIVRSNVDATAAGSSTRYLVLGTAGQRVTARVRPVAATVDLRVDRRNRDESIPAGGTANAGGPGGEETTSTMFGSAPAYLAFTATNLSAITGTNLDVDVSATAPLPFTDVCATGVVLPAPLDGAGDDEWSAVQTLPAGFSFSFFGVAQRQYVLGANGLLVFGASSPACAFGCYANTTLPAAAEPNGFIAGYWDDLEQVRVCRKDEATKVTLQWSGRTAASGSAVQFQVVLQSSGRIDLVYGPDHQANGASATLGGEDAAGAVAVLQAFDTADSTPPRSSYSFVTPAP